MRPVQRSRTASTAASAESTRSKKGTSTGRARHICTMPRISGQKGARISTSSSGAASMPTAAASPAVAPPVASSWSRSQARPFWLRSFSTSASSSSGRPRVGV